MPFAHRGGHDGGFPENSLDAFNDAINRGAMIETDVRLSLDGEPVLAHDGFALRRRLPAVPALMPASWLAWLGVPRLADLLAIIPAHHHVSIDLKKTAAWPAVIEVARSLNAVGRLWLVHDDLGLLQTIRAEDAAVRLVHEARPQDLAASGWTLEGHPDRLIEAGVDAQNTTASAWTSALVSNAHDRGILAFGSLIQSRSDLRRAAALGLDALYSDHVSNLVEIMGASRRQP